MVPDYLTDQNEDYIKARGYSFRHFSAEQILDQLCIMDIRIALHGMKNQQRGFTTIIDKIAPAHMMLGRGTRWAILKNPFSLALYRCTRRKRNALQKDKIDKRASKLRKQNEQRTSHKSR